MGFYLFLFVLLSNRVTDVHKDEELFWGTHNKESLFSYGRIPPAFLEDVFQDYIGWKDHKLLEKIKNDRLRKLFLNQYHKFEFEEIPDTLLIPWSPTGVSISKVKDLYYRRVLKWFKPCKDGSINCYIFIPNYQKKELELILGKYEREIEIKGTPITFAIAKEITSVIVRPNWYTILVTKVDTTTYLTLFKRNEDNNIERFVAPNKIDIRSSLRTYQKLPEKVKSDKFNYAVSNDFIIKFPRFVSFAGEHINFTVYFLNQGVENYNYLIVRKEAKFSYLGKNLHLAEINKFSEIDRTNNSEKEVSYKVLECLSKSREIDSIVVKYQIPENREQYCLERIAALGTNEYFELLVLPDNPSVIDFTIFRDLAFILLIFSLIVVVFILLVSVKSREKRF